MAAEMILPAGCPTDGDGGLSFSGEGDMGDGISDVDALWRLIEELDPIVLIWKSESVWPPSDSRLIELGRESDRRGGK